MDYFNDRTSYDIEEHNQLDKEVAEMREAYELEYNQFGIDWDVRTVTWYWHNQSVRLYILDNKRRKITLWLNCQNDKSSWQSDIKEERKADAVLEHLHDKFWWKTGRLEAASANEYNLKTNEVEFYIEQYNGDYCMVLKLGESKFVLKGVAKSDSIVFSL